MPPGSRPRLARRGPLCLLPLLLAACAAPPQRLPAPEALPPVAHAAALAPPALPAAAAVVPRTPPDYQFRLERESDLQRGRPAATLTQIAAAARADQNLYVHVEGYAAGAGSPALKLGWNDRVLRLIRARLLAQGADGRRIYLYNRGESEADAGTPAAHVEIFLVRG